MHITEMPKKSKKPSQGQLSQEHQRRYATANASESNMVDSTPMKIKAQKGDLHKNYDKYLPGLFFNLLHHMYFLQFAQTYMHMHS